MLELGASLKRAIELYDEPIGTEAHDKFQDASQCTFQPDPYHEVVLTIWKSRVHQVVYWSTHPDPDRDIVAVGEFYSGGNRWVTLTDGYLYRRSDGYCFMWCSAIPAIGVGTAEFRDATPAAEARVVESA